MDKWYKFVGVIILCFPIIYMINLVHDVSAINKLYEEKGVVGRAQINDFIPYNRRISSRSRFIDMWVSCSYINNGKKYNENWMKHYKVYEEHFDEKEYFCEIGDSIPILFMPSDPNVACADTARVYRILRQRGRSDLLKY
jgi:hypothetical protein